MEQWQVCERWSKQERDFCEMGSIIWAGLNAERPETRSVAIEREDTEMKIA